MEKKDAKVLGKWHPSTNFLKITGKLRISFFWWHWTSTIFSTMIWKPYNSHRNLAIWPISSQQNRELYAVFCTSKKHCFKMEVGTGDTCQDYSWVSSKERNLSYTSQCSSLIHHLYFSCLLTGKKVENNKRCHSSCNELFQRRVWTWIAFMMMEG